MTDYIKREDAIGIVKNLKRFSCFGDDGFVQIPMVYCELMKVAPADVAPVRHEEDGTLWVTVGDCEKVGRVIVKNEQGHFCRVFYMGDGDDESNCGARMDGDK